MSMSAEFQIWVNNCCQQKFANIESGSRLFGNRTQIRNTLINLGFVTDPHNSKRMLYPVCSPIVKSEIKPQAITSYVCGTEVDHNAFALFLKLCTEQNLIPVIIPIKYKNPTSLEEALSQEDSTDLNSYIAPEVRPYLRSSRYKHNPDVVVLADIKPQITAVNPLNGLESVSKGSSAVLGHITQQLKSVPRMLPAKPIILVTTGTISKVEFGSNLAAKKAEFHVIHGCVIVEDQNIKIRHIVFDDDHADDLGVRYSLLDFPTNTNTSFAFLGDIHFGAEDPVALQWAIKICKKVNPDHVILNDTFDGQTINHHTHKTAEKYRRFKSVTEEVKYHNKEIKKICQMFKDVKIVESNHNQWFDRWLSDIHPIKDLHNISDQQLYASVLTGKNVLQGSVLKSGSLINKYSIFHGHEGVNGGKMAAGALMRIGSKSVYAHTHTPFASQGVYNPGCLCLLDQDYTRGGLTSWCHGLVIISTGGKAQVLLKWD